MIAGPLFAADRERVQEVPRSERAAARREVDEQQSQFGWLAATAAVAAGSLPPWLEHSSAAHARTAVVRALQRSRGNEYVQRAVTNGRQSLAVDPEAIERALADATPGERLDASVRERLEHRLGIEVGDVRVHTDSQAQALSCGLQAEAFTRGHDIYFDTGRFRPESSPGFELLAHEISHVAQQESGAVSDFAGAVVPASHTSEREAQQAAAGGAALGAQVSAAPAAPAIQRQVVAQSAARLVSTQLSTPGTELGLMQASTAPQAAPQTVAVGATRLPTLDEASRDIWRRLQEPSVRNVDQILTTLQLLFPQMDDLKAEYKRFRNAELMDDLRQRLVGGQLLRAKMIMERGTLRFADKLYLSVLGEGTDEDTLYRLLPKVKSDPTVEAEFAQDYGKEFSKGGTLPDGTSVQSSIIGMLEDELSDWELDKAKALLAFEGKIRPIDEIRIATNQNGTDEATLYRALETGIREAPGTTNEEKHQALAAQYKLYYNQDLDELIDDELSFGEYRRARMILAGDITEGRIEIAVSGAGTDEDAIFSAIAEAPMDTRKKLYDQFKSGEAIKAATAEGLELPESAGIYKKLFEDLSTDDLERVEALLLKNEKTDTAIELLKQAGAYNDGDDLLAAVKNASDADRAVYARDYDNNKVFQRHIIEVMDNEEQDGLWIVLKGSVKQKLWWAMGTEANWRADTDEDYIFQVLGKATDAEKKEVAQDEKLMDQMGGWFGELSTSDFNRVRDLLRTSDETVQERIANTEAQVERERSWLAEGTNAGWALRDEQREMFVTLQRAKADGQLSVDEQRKLIELESNTREALETYKTVRNELEEVASQVITTAAAIIITGVTLGAGGAAAIALTALNVARSAVIMGITRVLAMKVAKGDRFDVMGTEGAIAFGAGAIDGAMNVIAPAVAGKFVGSLFPGAVKQGVEEVAQVTFTKFGPRLLANTLEGGMSAGPSALFENIARVSDMNGRLEDKISIVGFGFASAVGTGAVLSGGIETVRTGAGVAYGRFFGGGEPLFPNLQSDEFGGDINTGPLISGPAPVGARPTDRPFWTPEADTGMIVQEYRFPGERGLPVRDPAGNIMLGSQPEVMTRMRIHSPDPTAPVGSPSQSQWTVGFDQSNARMLPDGTWFDTRFADLPDGTRLDLRPYRRGPDGAWIHAQTNAPVADQNIVGALDQWERNMRASHIPLFPEQARGGTPGPVGPLPGPPAQLPLEFEVRQSAREGGGGQPGARRRATAEGVGESFTYGFHPQAEPAIVERAPARSRGDLPENPAPQGSVDPEVPERWPDLEEGMPPPEAEVLPGPLDEGIPPQRLQPQQGLPESLELARRAGVPAAVYGDGWVMTRADFPDVVPEEPLPLGRPAPEGKPTTGRTVSRSEIQNVEVRADLRLTQDALEGSGAQIFDVRIDQTQTSTLGGAAGTNRPDLQLTILEAELSGRRIHIEYDRSPPTRALAHARRILANDPEAIVILKIVDFDG